MNDEVIDVSSTKKSKIVKYKIEEDVVMLRQSGMSYQQIADELNSNGKVPVEDPLDKYVVMRFLEKLPQIQQQIIREDKKRLVSVVNANMDIVHEISDLYGKSKMLLNMMEEDAYDRNKTLDPYRFKAIASEMRELLKQMTDIQKEINDYNNIRKFMEIVLETLKHEAPESIPTIAQKLRMTKGTNWFADMVNRGN